MCFHPPTKLRIKMRLTNKIFSTLFLTLMAALLANISQPAFARSSDDPKENLTITLNQLPRPNHVGIVIGNPPRKRLH